MGLWDKLTGKASKPPPQIRAMTAPDPIFLGKFLVFSLLESRFGLSEQETDGCVAELPEELKDPGKLWTKIYLAWIFRMLVKGKYGDAFTEAMMSEVDALMSRAQELSGEESGLRNVFTFWFAKIDAVMPMAGKEINGQVVPFEVFAALTFLVSDSSSPYFNQEQITNIAEFDVASALIKAKDKVLPSLQRVVEIGALVEVDV